MSIINRYGKRITAIALALCIVATTIYVFPTAENVQANVSFSGISDIISTNTEERPFRVVEIVPSADMGEIGFLFDGQEPFAYDAASGTYLTWLEKAKTFTTADERKTYVNTTAKGQVDSLISDGTTVLPLGYTAYDEAYAVDPTDTSWTFTTFTTPIQVSASELTNCTMQAASGGEYTLSSAYTLQAGGGYIDVVDYFVPADADHLGYYSVSFVADTYDETTNSFACYLPAPGTQAVTEGDFDAYAATYPSTQVYYKAKTATIDAPYVYVGQINSIVKTTLNFEANYYYSVSFQYVDVPTSGNVYYTVSGLSANIAATGQYGAVNSTGNIVLATSAGCTGSIYASTGDPAYSYVGTGKGNYNLVYANGQYPDYAVTIPGFYYKGGFANRNIFEQLVFNQNSALAADQSNLYFDVDTYSTTTANSTEINWSLADLIYISGGPSSLTLPLTGSDGKTFDDADVDDLTWATVCKILSVALDSGSRTPVFLDYYCIPTESSTIAVSNEATNIQKLSALLLCTNLADLGITANSFADSAFTISETQWAQMEFCNDRNQDLCYVYRNTFVYPGNDESQIPAIMQDLTTIIASETENAAFLTAATAAGFQEIADSIINENYIIESETPTGTTPTLFDLKINRAIAMEYCITYVGKRTSSWDYTINVLDIEPSMVSSANEEVLKNAILSWFGEGYLVKNVTVTHMTSSEFIGKIEDLTNYDMIYFGLCTDQMNMSGGRTVYNDTDMNGLIYVNVGDVVVLDDGYWKDGNRKIDYNMTGMLDSDYNSNGTTYYPTPKNGTFREISGKEITSGGSLSTTERIGIGETGYTKIDIGSGEKIYYVDAQGMLWECNQTSPYAVTGASAIASVTGYYTSTTTTSYFYQGRELTVVGEYGYYQTNIPRNETRYVKKADGTFQEAGSRDRGPFYRRVKVSGAGQTHGVTSTTDVTPTVSQRFLKYTLPTTTKRYNLDTAHNSYRYSGNDLTTAKVTAVQNFVAGGYPVVFADGFLTTSGGSSSVNTEYIDNCSNMYELAKSLLFPTDTTGASVARSGNVYTATEAASTRTKDLYKTISTGNPEINMLTSSASTGKIELTGNTVQLSFTITTQGTANALYDCNLYLDSNADGKYSTTTEEVKATSLRIYKDGVLVTPTATNGVYHYSLAPSGSTIYTLECDLPSTYVGIIPYRLQIAQVDKQERYDSYLGYIHKQKPAGTQAETIKILQILSNVNKTSWSKATFNMQTEYEKTNSEFRRLVDGVNDFKLNITTLTDVAYYKKLKDDPNYLNQFNMLVLGFADCYDLEENYTEGDKTYSGNVTAIRKYISDGKPVLFTHDSTSFSNDKNSQYWAYDFNSRVRDVVGMDRYGILNSTALKVGVPLTKDSTTAQGTTTIGALFTEALNYATTHKTDIAYKPNSNKTVTVKQQQGYVYKQIDFAANSYGYSAVDKYSYLKSGVVGDERTTKVEQVNSGQITTYPYEIPESFTVAKTHYQYYQLDLNEDADKDGQSDIVVWYTLASDGTSNNSYSDSPRDVRNNYYIYTKGNVTYSGVGHSDISGNSYELKLYINTMIAAYSVRTQAPELTFYSDAAATDEEGSIFITVDKALNQVVEGSGDIYEDVYFRVADKNIVKDLNHKEIMVDLYYAIGSQTGSDLSLTIHGQPVYLKKLTGTAITKVNGDALDAVSTLNSNNKYIPDNQSLTYKFTLNVSELLNSSDSDQQVQIYAVTKTNFVYDGQKPSSDTAYGYTPLTVQKMGLADLD